MENLLYRYNKNMLIKYKFVSNVNEIIDCVKNKTVFYHGTNIASLCLEQHEILHLKELAKYIGDVLSLYFYKNKNEPNIYKYRNLKENGVFNLAFNILVGKMKVYEYNDFYICNNFDKVQKYINSHSFGEMCRLVNFLVKAKEDLKIEIEDEKLNKSIKEFKNIISSYKNFEPVILIFENVSNNDLEYETGGKLRNNAKPLTDFIQSYRYKGDLYNKTYKALNLNQINEINDILRKKQDE